MRAHALGTQARSPGGPRALVLELQAPKHHPTRALGQGSHTFSSTPASAHTTPAAQAIAPPPPPSPSFGLTFTLARHRSVAPFSVCFFSLSSFLPHTTQALLTMVSYHTHLQTLTPAQLPDELCPAHTPYPHLSLPPDSLAKLCPLASNPQHRILPVCGREPQHMTTAAFPRYDNKCTRWHQHDHAH